MDCGTISAHKFRTRLGFKEYDAILTLSSYANI